MEPQHPFTELQKTVTDIESTRWKGIHTSALLGIVPADPYNALFYPF